ncbi:MAG TPA: DUF481 domain-containing protein [Bryobacteraceae bacterium]|nr:DUF481 domain-containing protein [Bryobacteraceae bacterium]
MKYILLGLLPVRRTVLYCLLLTGVSHAFAQKSQNPATSKSNSEADVLLFNNGEKLIGHLERIVGSSVVFKSDMAGEITVDVSKVKEIHSPRQFAVIGKNVVIGKHESRSGIPQGPIRIENQQVTVSAAPSAPQQTVPLGSTRFIVDEPTFTKDLLAPPNFFQNWKGSATAGVSLVLATQKNRTITSAISLVRTVPNDDWLEPENRTTVSFNSAYGSLSQPDTPTIKTSLFHAEAERDQYFSPRVFYFGSGAWDHNISQGLDLQQTYGAGIGLTVVKDANQELNLRASLDYINQKFNPILIIEATGKPPVSMAAPYSNSLIGSVFGETYNTKLPKNIFLNEFLTITPSWNNLSAYSTNAGLNLTLPIYKRLAITIGTIDTFLNNPPTGFKKNSFQFTSGVTYTLP